MNNEARYRCATARKFTFASGAADLAEISDRATRRLTKQDKGKTHCLVEVSSRVADILVGARVAQKESGTWRLPHGLRQSEAATGGF